ncbi:MAG: prolyl oligopeptidase family serine peptidase [Chlorobi bacterium]|nr:prolyl oligopeptidase family serine peptidase [Chlorobiota bacterium]
MIILYTLLTFILINFLLIYFVAPQIIIRTKGGIARFAKDNNFELLHPDDLLLDNERINIFTHDSLNLSAYLIKTKSEIQKGTIILLHGIRSRKENNLWLSKKLSDEGYNSVVIDLRAHGFSQGKYCTFGYHEKHDIIALIDILYNIEGLNLNLGIWGQSLGGAVSMQTLEIDKRLKFGIVESTFTNFKTIAHDYFKRYIGFDIPFLTNYALKRAEKLANFKVDEVSPVNSAKKITQPMLIVHGENDEKIKFEYGKMLFNNLASKDKYFINIPNSSHSNLREIGGEEYLKKVLNFINKNSK